MELFIISILRTFLNLFIMLVALSFALVFISPLVYLVFRFYAKIFSCVDGLKSKITFRK